MLNRRRFIQFSLAGLAATSLGSRSASLFAATPTPRFFSAVDDRQGRHYITALDQAGNSLFQLAIEERCHAGCQRPASREVAILARRPGRGLYILDSQAGVLLQRIHAGDEHHFYGHGVFSPDGRYLYVTANHFVTGEGQVRVYDAQQAYQHVADFPVQGMDPHELRLHPDGNTLVIALGGIHTHPDYDRIKLNLDSMAPALVLMDRRSGAILQRHQPSHHQLSCHHLDISADGIVIAGYQFEGPVWETPPLIARLDTASGEFSEVELEIEQLAAMKNYTASVAISRHQPHAAITAPRGNRVAVIDYRTGKFLQSVSVPDVAGVLADDVEGFIVSSGLGGLYRVRLGSENAELLSGTELLWDNHFT